MTKISQKFYEKIETRKRCKGVHCVDLGESFPTSIYLQKSASIQPRTSPSKFGGKIQFNIHFTPRCGQMRDVRLPLKITDEQFSCTALGDGFCLLLQDDNVKALGRKCVQLGLGPNFDENHMEKFQPQGRLEKHEAYLRFDTSTFLGRGNIITTPTPCKLPKMTVQAVLQAAVAAACSQSSRTIREPFSK